MPRHAPSTNSIGACGTGAHDVILILIVTSTANFDLIEPSKKCDATKLKRKLLESRGYLVVTKWECEWDREVKINERLKEFLASHEMVEPLNQRDTLFGGRTNAVRLNHAVREGEQIEYVDVTSL